MRFERTRIGADLLEDGAVTLPKLAAAPMFTGTRPRPAWIDLCEDSWTAVWGTITYPSDEGYFLAGAKSMKIVGRDDKTDYNIQVYRTVARAALAAHNLRLRYYVANQGNALCTSSGHATGDNQGLVLFLQQTDPVTTLTNYSPLNYMPVTPGWHDIVFNASKVEFQGLGAFDIDVALTGYYLRVAGDFNYGDAPIVYVDSLEAWPADVTAGQKAWFAITFDDAFVEQVPAIRHCISLGIPCTLAVASHAVDAGSAAHMTWAQIKTFHETGMVHISQHHSVFPYTGTDSEKRAYMRASRSALTRQGIGGFGPQVYVIPSGTDGVADGNRPSVADIKLMREYGIVRGTHPWWTGVGYDDFDLSIGQPNDGRWQPKDSPNRWWFPSRGCVDGDQANIDTWLALCEDHGGFYNCHVHLVEIGGSQDMTLTNLKTMLTAVAARADTKCVTYETVMNG